MHKRLLMAAVVVLAAATSTSAWAGWGCAFTGTDIKGKYGRMWGWDTRKEASEAALRLCQKDHQGCYVVACMDNVDSKEDADALWPMNGKALRTCGTGPGQERCP